MRASQTGPLDSALPRRLALLYSGRRAAAPSEAGQNSQRGPPCAACLPAHLGLRAGWPDADAEPLVRPQAMGSPCAGRNTGGCGCRPVGMGRRAGPGRETYGHPLPLPPPPPSPSPETAPKFAPFGRLNLRGSPGRAIFWHCGEAAKGAGRALSKAAFPALLVHPPWPTRPAHGSCSPGVGRAPDWGKSCLERERESAVLSKKRGGGGRLRGLNGAQEGGLGGRRVAAPPRCSLDPLFSSEEAPFGPHSIRILGRDEKDSIRGALLSQERHGNKKRPRKKWDRRVFAPSWVGVFHLKGGVKYRKGDSEAGRSCSERR